ncbi:MAG: hypothetical protein ACRD9L_06810 [Bryobacteraceae bacterium]
MRNSMYPLPRTAFHAPHLLHDRAKLLALVAICAAGLPYQLSAQWTTGSGGTIYYNGGNVGIGTASPSEKLQIGDGTGATGIAINGANSAASGAYIWGKAAGTNEWLISSLRGWLNGGVMGLGVGTISATPYAFFTNTSERMRIDGAGNVGIGTTTPQHLLHVAGTIGAEEVIVSSTGADYVFHPDYRLMPLSEVARYIDKNHHLPGVPSSSEVKEKGVNLGEMQAKLLAKIEEITLHVIEEEKENQELKRRIGRLEASGGNTAPAETK